MANRIYLYDPSHRKEGDDIAVENIYEFDTLDADKCAHREISFKGAKTSGTYNIVLIGKYINIRREVDGITTILNTNLDTHDKDSQVSLMAVEGARYVIDGAIKKFAANHNMLTSIDVSRCACLRHLEVEYNDIKKLDVSRCTALNALSYIGNEGIEVITR